MKTAGYLRRFFVYLSLEDVIDTFGGNVTPG
jgi:hypothetical protein